MNSIKISFESRKIYNIIQEMFRVSSAFSEKQSDPIFEWTTKPHQHGWSEAPKSSHNALLYIGTCCWNFIIIDSFYVSSQKNLFWPDPVIQQAILSECPDPIWNLLVHKFLHNMRIMGGCFIILKRVEITKGMIFNWISKTSGLGAMEPTIAGPCIHNLANA